MFMSPTELSMFPIQKIFFTFQIVILPIKIVPFPFKLVTFGVFDPTTYVSMWQPRISLGSSCEKLSARRLMICWVDHVDLSWGWDSCGANDKGHRQ
jgi:hypothetical protein